MTRIHLFDMIIIILLLCISNICSANLPRLLIISLDGFAHYYLQNYSLPTLNRLQQQGIKTKFGMQPTFATMTYPNHMSIATGMYQEDHGIIHNRFYDRKLKANITFGTQIDGLWSDPKVEPVWITATKQNVNAGLLFWPACQYEFQGVRPLIYSSVYSDIVGFKEKIDNAIEYFKKTSVQLVMLYHFEPDRQGHVYGPDADELKQTLFRLDGNLDYLLTRVKKDLNDDLNIIIVSDHGMAKTKRFIRPFDEGYLDKTQIEEGVLDGTLFSVTPVQGKFDEVFNSLQRIPNVTVYRRDQFPDRYHYAKAVDRVGEIIVLTNDEETYFLQSTSAISPAGAHGYDNTLPSMQAIFIAHGPDFNQAMEIDALKNVDIYHIICKILNLKASPYATAGSLQNLTNIFRQRTNYSSKINVNFIIIFFLLVTHLFLK